MTYGHGDFEYRLHETVPKEFREVDWTYLRLRGRPFSECQQVFEELKTELHNAFAGNHFFYLHFLRAIEDRLLWLALDTQQPLAQCLEQLRRRMELEYSREDIYGKAAMALVLADYAATRGDVDLARSLLEQEREQLSKTAEVCSNWIETITQRIDTLADVKR
jgi:hypothetical protein